MVGSKQWVEVKCIDCKKSYPKRKDTILRWNHLCASCSLKKVNRDPKMKELHHRLGLDFIKRFGKIPSPKMENRGRGKNHYNWRGGITPFRIKVWQSKEYGDWRKSVFERDGYKCVMCHQNTHALQADHIKPFAVFLEERLKVDNGRTLCIPCHRKYGARVLNGVVTRKAILENNGAAWVAI